MKHIIVTQAEFDSFCAQLLIACKGKRFSRGTERTLQDGLAQVFNGLFRFEREFILSKQDRADFFFIENGVVMEVKIKGWIEAHLRQMKRYADHEIVKAVILVANKPFDVPETIGGKPARCFNFGPKFL